MEQPAPNPPPVRVASTPVVVLLALIGVLLAAHLGFAIYQDRRASAAGYEFDSLFAAEPKQYLELQLRGRRGWQIVGMRYAHDGSKGSGNDGNWGYEYTLQRRVEE
jgi:hypothetical protein